MFEGLPNEAVLVFAASGTGLSPVVVPDIRFDDTNLLTAGEGDGAVPSEEAVRLSAMQYAKKKGKLTAAQRAGLEEYERKIAEREKLEKKAIANNSLRGKYLKEGNAAFKSKNYEEALAKYEAGYQLDPDFLGGAPVFLNNKAQALKSRSVLNYNNAVKSKDRSAITNARNNLIKDFTQALVATTKVYGMTVNPKSTEGTNAKRLKEDSDLAKEITKDIFRIMGKININLASSITTVEEAKGAVSMYKTSLDILPDNPDVLAGLAMALYSSGDFNGNLDEKKQSLELWNKFKTIAPKDHKQQETANGMIEFLKEELK